MSNEQIAIAPTNANKFLKAIEKISEAAGLIQTTGVNFQTIFPVVTKLMEVLGQLNSIQSSFLITESGRGRPKGSADIEITMEEVAQLEAEVQALAQPVVPERKLSHLEQLTATQGIESPGEVVN